MRQVSFFLIGAVLAAGSLTATAQQPAETLVQQFQHVEDNWSVALVNKDQFTLDNLIAPAYIDISAQAQVRTRNQYISDSLSGLPEALLSAQQRAVDVHLVGDVAIVEGTYKFTWHIQGVPNHDERGIFTHVYERVHGAWSSISAQRTAVIDTDANDTGKDSGKKKKSSNHQTSNADLPLQLPFLSHGDSAAASGTAN